MLFFDDLSFNISEVGELGVHAFQVMEGGISMDVLRNGLESFCRTAS